MAEVRQVYERLLAAVSGEGPEAGVRLTSLCQPSGGSGTRVMPPTYPGGDRYLIDERAFDDGVHRVVLLDSYQSQANRVEEALLGARDQGRISLPLFEMSLEVSGWPIRLTSLDFPHRYADAYLRDSTIGGVRFDQTDIGSALRVAEPHDATAVYAYDPGALVFGAWNSHRSGRQAKFSRCYRSESLGVNIEPASRKGGRLDPLNLTGAIDDAAKKEADWKFVVGEKAKGKRLSEIGHGNALSGDESPGGFTVEEIRRLGFISFAQLSRLGFGSAGPEAAAAGRAALAALALAGDRLAFDRPGLAYRSGCELTVVTDEVQWEHRGMTVEPLELDTSGALALFSLAAERASSAGLPMQTETVEIEPIDSLRQAIEHSFLTAEPQD